MGFSAKDLLPLSVRTQVKRLGYRVLDILTPVTTPRVPPRAQTFIGGGNFEAVGDHFKQVLTRHGLTPDMHVLDVGCGQGRMARPLVGFFNGGTYTGFDIVKDGIDWCQAQYADATGFTFLHANVFNERYNIHGEVLASEYTFPFETARYDRVFLTSVFTHMFAKDVENYLSEIGRVLKPGGVCLITWFLINDQSRAAPAPQLDFRFDVDAVSKTTLKENPEAAIAFDEAYVRALYDKLGLIIETTEYGRWADPGSPYQLQDMVVARKR